jgi:DNA gyrase subunit A
MPYGYVKPASLEEEMKKSYLSYAMSVIVSRALPDVRDGLKPVQRRILYAMHDLGMRPGSSFKKSARLVGEVLGKYHPHGDSAVYEAMVRMAQDFSLRVPLVDGQGNFGSVDGDPPAAMRYTESRLTREAELMLSNLDQDTVDYSENFDGTLEEPAILPARLPNLLVNGATGIAVGMATNIPPHNPTEVCNGIIQLIENPDSTMDELMKHIKGPDFPTGATIMGKEGIRNAFETGRGQVIVRATATIEEAKRSSKMKIVVSELPYQVNKASLVEKIAGLIKTKRLEGISEVRDESDRKGMRIVMELRSGAQAFVILNNLYKYTPMQSSFSVNMIALANGVPKLINVKESLGYYIKFREEVISRKFRFELKKAKARCHILDGYRVAIANIDEVIDLIRSSQDVDEAKTQLISKFSLDAIQAQAILEMQLRRLAALETQKIEDEYQNLQERIRYYEEQLGDPNKILAVVSEETQEMKKSLRGARRTAITATVQEFTREELEAHEQIVVTLSEGGYVKRIPADTYRNQHRGGKGVVSMNIKDDDPVKHIIVCDTHDTMLFFTNKGRVLAMRSFELRADIARNTRGVPVRNVIALAANETVKSIIGVNSLKRPDLYLVLATKNASIKKVQMNKLSSLITESGQIRRGGLIVMKVKSGDEVVSAKNCKEDDDVMMVTQNGKSIRFAITDILSRSRQAGGVRGMLLDKKDNMIAMDVVVPESRLLVISKNGYGKLTDLEKYRPQKRAGSGLKTMNITKKTGTVAAAEVIAGSDEVYVISRKAQVMRTSLDEIRKTGRVAQGVTIFKPRPGDYVSAMACMREFKYEDQPEQLKLVGAKLLNKE